MYADESGSLPAAAALALTLHHLTGGRQSQDRQSTSPSRYHPTKHNEGLQAK